MKDYHKVKYFSVVYMVTVKQNAMLFHKTFWTRSINEVETLLKEWHEGAKVNVISIQPTGLVTVAEKGGTIDFSQIRQESER